MRLGCLGLLVMVSAPGLAIAADPPPPWSGELSAGVVNTTGNSETSTANAKGEVVFNSERWRNTSSGAAIKAEQTAAGVEVVSAERYSAGNKTDFNFDERNYAFVALEFEKDLIGPIRERTSETAGYGRKILTGPKHLLEAEIGAGARQTEEQGTGEDADDLIGRGRAAYKWNFSETSHLGETVKVESGDSNTFAESVTELKVSLVGKLFALGSYTVRQNTDVPPGAKKTDTITAISLGWSFGK